MNHHAVTVLRDEAVRLDEDGGLAPGAVGVVGVLGVAPVTLTLLFTTTTWAGAAVGARAGRPAGPAGSRAVVRGGVRALAGAGAGAGGGPGPLIVGRGAPFVPGRHAAALALQLVLPPRILDESRAVLFALSPQSRRHRFVARLVWSTRLNLETPS